MKRLITGLATVALASGGLGLASLDAGTAQATCTPDTGGYACGYGLNHWCPGDSLYFDRGGPVPGRRMGHEYLSHLVQGGPGRWQCSRGPE
jgi:hypothetical protein